jgi:hypothetical protein
MADGFRDWPTPHAENWAKLGRLERALWRVADWPVVGVRSEAWCWTQRTPEIVPFVHQPRHDFVDPA